jgi:hypothetical protein
MDVCNGELRRARRDSAAPLRGSAEEKKYGNFSEGGIEHLFTMQWRYGIFAMTSLLSAIQMGLREMREDSCKRRLEERTLLPLSWNVLWSHILSARYAFR